MKILRVRQLVARGLRPRRSRVLTEGRREGLGGGTDAVAAGSAIQRHLGVMDCSVTSFSRPRDTN